MYWKKLDYAVGNIIQQQQEVIWKWKKIGFEVKLPKSSARPLRLKNDATDQKPQDLGSLNFLVSFYVTMNRPTFVQVFITVMLILQNKYFDI